MKRKFDVMTLCAKCRRDYESIGGYYIRRTYTDMDGMGKCTKCHMLGREYEIMPKERNVIGQAKRLI